MQMGKGLILLTVDLKVLSLENFLKEVRPKLGFEECIGVF